MGVAGAVGAVGAADAAGEARHLGSSLLCSLVRENGTCAQRVQRASLRALRVDHGCGSHVDRGMCGVVCDFTLNTVGR